MVELRVPEIVEDPFREHYRALIVGSLLRAAEAESARHRAQGHRIRARRAQRAVDRLSPPGPVAQPPVARPSLTRPPFSSAVAYDTRFGPRIRRAAAVIWFASLGALLADVVFLGVDSYATAAADLGLVAMTLVWFFACIDDLTGPGS